MTGDKDKLLNQPNELITKNRHVDKFVHAFFIKLYIEHSSYITESQ